MNKKSQKVLGKQKNLCILCQKSEKIKDVKRSLQKVVRFCGRKNKKGK